MLFTTRDADIAAAVGACEHSVDLLDPEQCREVLANGWGLPISELPAESEDLIRECGRLPLALSMVAAMLRNKPRSAWMRVLAQLRNAHLQKIRAEFPNYPHTDLLRAMQVSVDALDEVSRERYLGLAVLLEDMPVYPAIQRTLWKVDENEAEETAERFISRSLAQRDGAGIRLHDLQLDFVRAQYADREALRLIHGAVWLSSHVLAKDPAQFAPQLIGRLLPYADQQAIQDFIELLSKGAPRPLLRPMHPPGTALLRTLEGHYDSVNGVALSADGRRAVSASEDRTLKVWDVESGRELRTLAGHSGTVFGVALSADGQRAVSASWDGTLKVWEIESGRELGTLSGHSSWVYGVALRADGRLAVSASDDHTLKVWDLESGRKLLMLKGHTGPIGAIALSADERRAVSASSDKTLKVWDVEGGHELCTFEGHSGAVNAVALTADGRAISASNDHTLKVWDVESGREVRTLYGHSDAVEGVALSADGRRAVSASEDGSILKIWDVKSGRELRTLQAYPEPVFALALSADGQWAISACYDGTVQM